jgi:hypothetical protein
MPPNSNDPAPGPDPPESEEYRHPGGYDPPPETDSGWQNEPSQPEPPSDTASASPQQGPNPDYPPAGRPSPQPPFGQIQQPPQYGDPRMAAQGPPPGGYTGWPPQGPPPRQRTGLIIGVVIAITVLVLGGLSLVFINMLRDDGAESGGGAESHADVESPTAPGTTEPETSNPADDGVGAALFGDTYSYDDGVSITVAAPEEFDPSATAAFDAAPSYVRFTVTLANDGTESFDASMAFASAQSGNHEASEVFDSEQGLEGAPYTSVLTGRSVSWDIGFGVDDPEDVVLQISPSWGHEPAVFVSGLPRAY